ncbi:hypothetical protein [Pseudomonas lactis]|uniref:hypothetical protein n=1 Tax=Pseudomonas lactis TaxID=1615674 RepID=UPI003F7FD8F6
MSIQAEIARLTGKLVFDVNTAPLQRFQALMNRTTQQMSKLGVEYSRLAASISKPLKMNIDTSAIDKAKARVDAVRNRELRGEVALANQKRLSFTHELSQQKLTYSGTKEQQSLVSSLVKSQQEGAVVAAKAHAAQMKAAGVTRQQLASQDALTASLTKQARLEAIVAKARAVARKADDNHLLAMNKTQRIQEQISRAADAANRQAIKHTAQMESLKRAEARKTTGEAQRDQRYQWAQKRQQVWQANRDAPTRSGGFGGMGGLLALGGIGAAIAGLTRAVGMIGERVQARQEGASEAEQYTNLFKQIGGGNQQTVDKFRSGYEKSSMANGTLVDLDSAKMFRTFAISEKQRGTSVEEILKKFEVQQQAYRIAGLTPEEIKRSNIQQQQIRGKGYGDTEDLNTMTEANPLLRPYLMKAWAEATKFKDATNPKKLESAFMAALPKRGLTRDILDRGQQLLVEDNKPTLELQQKSIQANQARNDSQAYLTMNRLNSQAELIDSVNSNIKAHQELAEAMQPVKAGMRDLDTALTKLMAGSIREILGKNADGTDKTPEERAQQLGTAGGADGVITLPNTNAQPRTTQQTLDAQANDPINKLWNWLGIGKDVKLAADENRDRWKNVKASSTGDIWDDTLGMNQATMPGFLPQFGFNIDALAERFGSLERQQAAAERGATASWGGAGVSGSWNEPVTNNIAPVVNIEGDKINIELHGASEEDRAKAMTELQQVLDKRDEKIPEQINRALTEIIMNARTMQSEVRK